MEININLVMYICAYLVGSIPFGLVLAKYFANVDVRQSGSKNIGATNVLRVLKQSNPKKAKIISACVLFLDIFKAVAILLVGKFLGLEDGVLWSLAILVVLGHCFSIYLFFEGGKGVASALGAFAVLIPIGTLVAVVGWVICAKVFKISSLSALVAMACLVVYELNYENGLGIDSNVPMAIIVFVVVYKHIPNIIRLINKEETSV